MATDRYTIISADCHAGADLAQYRQYLDQQWRDDFDAWAAAFVNPFIDLEDPTRVRNWDSSVRQRDLESDGIAAEVIFPNTVPPFFPSAQLVAAPPRANEDLAQRSAGLRAHNRWLVDFCAELPGRRAGLAQVFVNDVDDAVAQVAWAAEHGLKGVLVHAIPPDSGLAPLWSSIYDPLWAACQDHDITVTQHGGAGTPDFGESPSRNFLMLMEVPFFANRTLWHLILGGVFERFPKLRFVMTEQAVDWVPGTLLKMDYFWRSFTDNGFVGAMPADAENLAHPPSFYFNRNCWMGASFPSPGEAAAIAELGADRVMWGSDYPHREGTFPHSLEALQHGFSDWDPDALQRLLGGTAAEVYGLDYSMVDAVGVGPSVAAVATPLTEMPDSHSMAFRRP